MDDVDKLRKPDESSTLKLEETYLKTKRKLPLSPQHKHSPTTPSSLIVGRTQIPLNTYNPQTVRCPCRLTPALFKDERRSYGQYTHLAHDDVRAMHHGHHNARVTTP